MTNFGTESPCAYRASGRPRTHLPVLPCALEASETWSSVPYSERWRAAVSTSIARGLFTALPACWTRIGAEPRTVYLTFDDGPGPATLPLIEQLDHHDAHASFFFSGEACEQVEFADDILARAITSGHTVGLHGHHHLNAWRRTPATVRADHEQGLSTIQARTGIALEWARPPYGRMTPSLSAWYRKRGLSVALWDVTSADYAIGKRSRGGGSDLDNARNAELAADHIIQFVRSAVRSGSIVLMHENAPVWMGAPGAPARLIEALLADGWYLNCLPSIVQEL